MAIKNQNGQFNKANAQRVNTQRSLANGKPFSQLTKENKQQMSQEHNTPLKDVLMEQVKSMIKNGKKHFDKDGRSQVLDNIRGVLSTMANSAGEMPSTFDTTALCNQVLQDSVKTKLDKDALEHLPGQRGNGPIMRAQTMSKTDRPSTNTTEVNCNYKHPTIIQANIAAARNTTTRTNSKRSND